ncbi:hypothetical protein BGW38_003628 [Lunasporangiospora selenospora]|uniref:Calcineurin-like phosphoesterase n=1 Tax=Lunasporangiospora selenospora TaxID=979761 RepID=A0A9P6G2V9_9FUNG|nr:hypothetical protein BGW38_003628 [Lunasporangiospora selenospora]
MKGLLLPPIPILIAVAFIALATAAPVHKRLQPGAIQPDPVRLRPLTWGQINIIQTTDTHGWLPGHPKVPSYSGDFGDFASFVSHMRQQADRLQKDLLVVDSGDLVNGNGLSDATPVRGTVTRPFYKKINYDVLTLGNNELYEANVVEDVHKNFVPYWNGRYLTSNVFIKDAQTNETTPIGNLYSTFRLKFGTRVMSYGFLFSFTEAADNAIVEAPNITVTLPWFQESLKEPVDLYLIVAHIPVRAAEATTIVNAIRAVHPSKPIVVMGGHAHIRDFKIYDSRAVGFSGGRFMETIGWLSVDGIHDPACDASEQACIGKNLTVTRRYLDNNAFTYMTHGLGQPDQQFDTQEGLAISQEINWHYKAMNLSRVLGCSPQDYSITRFPVSHNQSLLRLITDEVVPLTVLDSSRPYPGYTLLVSSSQRYDIRKGPFTYDDSFAVSPFRRGFVSAAIPLKIAKDILSRLNVMKLSKRNVPSTPDSADSSLTPGYITTDDLGSDGDDWPHIKIPGVSVPSYVASPLPTGLQDEDLVEVIWLAVNSKQVLAVLETLDPGSGASKKYLPQVYRDGVTTNTMLYDFVVQKWTC